MLELDGGVGAPVELDAILALALRRKIEAGVFGRHRFICRPADTMRGGAVSMRGPNLATQARPLLRASLSEHHSD